MKPSENSAPPALVAGITVAPNPINPQAEIRFTLPDGGLARLEIYDVRGRKVCTLADGEFPTGEHLAVWKGQDDNRRSQPSGGYLAKLSAERLRAVERLTLLQ